MAHMVVTSTLGHTLYLFIHYLRQAFTSQPRLTLAEHHASCFSFLHTGILGMNHHAWQPSYFMFSVCLRQGLILYPKLVFMVVLLFQPPEFWGFRHEPPWWVASLF